MTEIQQNRYDQLVRRVSNIVGGGSMVSEVITELFPMFDVENLPGELFILGGTRLCVGDGSVTAGAGLHPVLQIFNPVDSGHIITVTTAYCGSNNDVVMNWGRSAAVLTTNIGTVGFRDSRAVGVRPVGQMFSDSVAAPSGGPGNTRILALTNLILHDQNSLAVLLPGEGFDISTNVLTSSLQATFYWRERVAEAAELNF